MIIALVVVAVLLFVAVVLLSNAFGSVETENSIRAKIAAFDAAEAGINQAVEALNQDKGKSTDCATKSTGNTTGALADGGQYAWCIEWNGIVSGERKVVDYGNKQPITVAQGRVYAWSMGTAQDGGRGVLIEAMIAPSTGLPLPSGAVVAASDVTIRSDVSIYESGSLQSDASIRSNGSIYVTQSPRVVQGGTYASGVDQVIGPSGTGHSGSPTMPLPSSGQISATVDNARTEAESTTGMMSPPSKSMTLTGDVFIEGDLDLQSGTVVFQHAKSVFINGNLCIHDGAQIVNDGATIWVNGVVASTSITSGGYTLASGSSGTLVVLGTDTGRPCSNGNGLSAVYLNSNLTQPIGLVYAPNGSIDLAGTGISIGAIDAGNKVWLDSTGGGGLQFEPNSIVAIPTYDYKVVSYMEY